MLPRAFTMTATATPLPPHGIDAGTATQMPTATPTSGMVHLVAGAQLLSLEWPGMPWGHGVYCRTLLPTWERHGVALGIISSQPFLYPFLCSSLIPLALFS